MKRFISFLIIPVLVLGLIPTIALAATDEGYFEYTVTSDNTIMITGLSDGYPAALEIPAEIDGMPVTAIGPQAFYRYSGLTSVIIPEGVTNIGEWAFCDCSNLTSVIIPDSVTNIGEWAFDYCWNLTSVRIPDGVTNIEAGTFGFCYSLTSVIIPGSVVSIGKKAFAECYRLKSISIPDGVTVLGDLAFEYCTSLTELSISKNVATIGASAFAGCSGLLKFTVDQDNPFFLADDDGVIFTKDKGKIVAYPGGRVNTDYTIPKGVSIIGYNAFGSCRGLTDITIPTGVTEIEPYAFSDTSLQSVTIPEGVTKMGEGVFLGCSELESISLPSTLTDVGVRLFNYCIALEEVELPYGWTSVPTGTFSYCSNLKDVIIPETVTKIGKEAFCGCESLEKVVLPNSVTTISSGAFWDCDNLRSIQIPPSVVTIAWDFFDKEGYPLIGVTIYGKMDSYAYRYAILYEIPFVEECRAVSNTGTMQIRAIANGLDISFTADPTQIPDDATMVVATYHENGSLNAIYPAVDDGELWKVNIPKNILDFCTAKILIWNANMMPISEVVKVRKL